MNQVSKSQPAAHTCRVWGAAEGILLISWVNIPQSRLPLSLSLLLFQKTMCAETAPAPTMRPACKAASPSPACANRATPVSCVRQVSTALGKKVGISSWEEMFFFFFSCVLRETQPFGRWLRAKTFPVYVGKRVQVELKVDLICKQLLFPPCHTPKQWTAVRKFTRLRRVSTKTLAELSSLLIDLQWNLNPVQN